MSEQAQSINPAAEELFAQHKKLIDQRDGFDADYKNVATDYPGSSEEFRDTVKTRANDRFRETNDGLKKNLKDAISHYENNRGAYIEQARADAKAAGVDVNLPEYVLQVDPVAGDLYGQHKDLATRQESARVDLNKKIGEIRSMKPEPTTEFQNEYVAPALRKYQDVAHEYDTNQREARDHSLKNREDYIEQAAKEAADAGIEINK